MEDGETLNMMKKLLLSKKNNKLSIIQIFSDGSKDVQEYKKGQ